ncbi:MAG: hypothetical protein ACT4N2_14405 [Hyphomicrobium sp.]
MPRWRTARDGAESRPHRSPFSGQVLSRAMPAIGSGQGYNAGLFRQCRCLCATPGRAAASELDGVALSAAEDRPGTTNRQMQKKIDRGSLDMRKTITAGKILLGAIVAIAAQFGLATERAVAQELSDQSVAKLMEYAWSLVPAQFSQPDGKVIITDKKKKEDSLVPLDVAKEVIRVGRVSAHAQVCELPDDQLANHRTMMRRETEKKKWTPQQMLYINQLHLVTVMLLTGKVKVTDKDGNKEVSIDQDKAAAQTCSEEEKSKVKSMVEAYVKQPVASAAPAEQPK